LQRAHRAGATLPAVAQAFFAVEEQTH